MKAVILVCGLCLLSTAVQAEMSANTFLTRYKTANPSAKTQLAQRLADMQTGMEWVNAFSRTHPPQGSTYCLPTSLVLDSSKLVDIVRKYVEDDQEQQRNLKKNIDVGKEPVGMVMLFALQKTFPCGSASK